jgi:hypothetical protein
MKIIIPVSTHDQHLIPNFYKAMEAFPISREHDLLIIGGRENEVTIKSLEEGVKHLFSSTETKLFEDTMLGWPGSCNYYFQQTCHYLASIGNNKPFFWFELDTTPTQSGWLDIICKKYFEDTTNAALEGRKARVYFGALERNYEGRNGELLPQSIAGNRMSPVGIYSSDITRIPVLSSLSASNRHWSSIIQWYTTPNLQDTKMIQNNWRTEKYRLEGNNIVCESIANLAWNVHFNNTIEPECLIVHGCKDGSLLEVLLNKNNPTMKVATNISLAEAKRMAEDFDESDEKDPETARKDSKKFALFKKKDNKEE